MGGGKIKFGVLEIVFLGVFCLLNAKTDAHILIYRRIINQLIEEYNDLPAQFGGSIPPNGLKVFAVKAEPSILACDTLAPPPISQNYPPTAKFVAIIERGNCSFELKIRNAQNAQFHAAIIFNDNGDDLEQMSAKNSIGISIPAVFVGHTSGINLQMFQVSEFLLVINDELPFNINTQLILPFSIMVGLCFLIVIFYMIYKCIREERRLRRYRLPKRLLKKLPILKYTKNSDLSYDTCVICLDEFVEGDKLRVLPCKHPYHSHCIDPWLTENRRVCPVCKRKVFTKGEACSNRNRQSSLDSVTDTDDDTTPLLPPTRGETVQRTVAATVAVAAPATSGRLTTSGVAVITHHGTFRRNSSPATDATSDEENVLSPQQTPIHSTSRMNPFNRASNPHTHLSEHTNYENQRSIWTLPIFRIFRRTQNPISVAAPAFLEEVVASGVATISLPRSTVTTSAPHSSNNILNPNLSGSFKDDEDEDEQLSIYEPIGVDSLNTNDIATAADSIFIQTPTQGGIGVVALPNTALDRASLI